MPAITDPRMPNTLVPNNVVKDQASVGLYFEYTYALCQTDPNTGGEIIMRNVSLFALGKMLFLRRSTGEVAVPVNSGATLKGGDVQSSFRDHTKLGRDLTDQEAFLTVVRAWEFATQRPKVASLEVATSATTTTKIAVGAHWLVSEPLFWPVNSKDTEAVRKGDTATARRVLKQAEQFWLGLATERAHSDGTPAHRFSRTSVPLDTSLLVGKMTMALIENLPETLTPYNPPIGSATDILPADLIQTAESELDWS